MSVEYNQRSAEAIQKTEFSLEKSWLIIGFFLVAIIAVLSAWDVIESATGALAGKAVQSPDRKIIVRRGVLHFDVDISERSEELTRHTKAWTESVQKFDLEIKDNVTTGFQLPHDRLAAEFMLRHQPEPTLRFLKRVLADEKTDQQKRIRATRWTLYCGNEDGLRWIISELENPHCDTPLDLLMVVGDWQQKTKQLKLLEIKLPPAETISRLFSDSFSQCSNRSTPLAEDDAKIDVAKLKAAFECVGDREAKPILKTVLTNQGEQCGDLIDWALNEYQRRFCDQWILNVCIRLAQHEIERSGRLSSTLKTNLNRICRKSTGKLQQTSINAYANLIQKASKGIELATSAIEQGVVFEDGFMDWFRNEVSLQADRDLNFAIKERQFERRKLNRFQFIEIDVLVAAFSGTNNQAVIDSLHQRNTQVGWNDGSPRSPVSTRHECAFAIEAVSGQAMDSALQQSTFGESIPPEVQCEFRTRNKQKTIADALRLFQKHGLASNTNTNDILNGLKQKIIDHGELCENSQRLLKDRDRFSSFEIICGLFDVANRKTFVKKQTQLQSDLWTLTDLTSGKFDPERVYFELERSSGSARCSFLLNGKRFSFRSSTNVASLIPPLNAILASEGFTENFAIIRGSSESPFLDDVAEKIIFAPAIMIDELEAEFGLRIAVR